MPMHQSRRPLRTRLRVLGTAAVAAAALVATSGTATAATEPSVPAGCSIWAYSIDASGQLHVPQYVAGQFADRVTGAKLGYVPQVFLYITEAGGPDQWRTRFWAVTTSGELRMVDYETVTNPATGATTHSTTQKVLGTSWKSIRGLTERSRGNYTYGLTDTGLKRYVIGAGGQTVTGAGTVNATGWSTIKTLTFDRTVQIGKTSTGAIRYADVLVATTADTGQLLEYRIPHDTPTSWTKKVLGTRGWSGFSALSFGFCRDASGAVLPNARPFVGVTSTGTTYAYYDPNGIDGVGTDIRGGTTPVGTMIGRPFSQS